jgi:hypothetical protein
MKDLGIVQGDEEQAKDLIIGKSTVYVHSNITPIQNEDGQTLYQYNEIQYDKDEYITMMAEQNTDLQLALCELYESMEV